MFPIKCSSMNGTWAPASGPSACWVRHVRPSLNSTYDQREAEPPPLTVPISRGPSGRFDHANRQCVGSRPSASASSPSCRFGRAVESHRLDGISLDACGLSMLDDEFPDRLTVSINDDGVSKFPNHVHPLARLLTVICRPTTRTRNRDAEPLGHRWCARTRVPQQRVRLSRPPSRAGRRAGVHRPQLRAR